MDLPVEPPIALILFVPVFLFYVYNKRKQRMSVLERSGIPGPRPNLLWGNLLEYYIMENVKWDTWLIETYGPIAGYYLGAKPFVVVADPELLDKIQHKDNQLFLDRPRRVPGGINPDPHRALMLGNLPVDEWKRMRKILSPSFTPALLKKMTNPITELIEKFLSKITEDSETDFYPKYQLLTLDIIGKSAFGLDSNIQDNPADPLLEAVKAEFSKTSNTWLVNFYLCFPEVSWLLGPIRRFIEKIKSKFGRSKSSPLWNQGRKALQLRCQNSNQGHDLLQRLLDAKVLPDQVVANCVLFFEAAYETLSSSLGFITHLLVNNPKVQDRVREELKSFLKQYDSVGYESVTELKYMDAVINEALRLFPPQTTFIGRAPSRDYEFTKTNADGSVKKYMFPKGIHIQVGLYQIHHSDSWDNPETFDPDRFVRKTKKESTRNIMFQAFGAGPRECIGKRFAMLVLKLTLGKLLSQYELKASEQTEGNITIKYKLATMSPKYGSHATPVVA